MTSGEFAAQVALRMRERDLAEVVATSRLQTREQWAEQIGQVVDSTPDSQQVVGGFMHQGKPTAVFGAIEHWPGVWAAWMVGTDDWPKVALAATRRIRKVCLPQVWRKGAHRIQAHSAAEYDTAHQWLVHLGAKEEAVLRGFGRNSEDFKVFVWRRDDV